MAPHPLPAATVVVCTRDRTELLEGCLRSLLALDYPDYEVLVVDNAPSDDATARLAAGLPVRYVREPRPGLDRARNRGLPLPLLWAGLWGALQAPWAYVATYRSST